jgi:hypothetical protein
MGRNEAYNHDRNLFGAVIAGLVAGRHFRRRVWVIIVSDLAKRTGRFNLIEGAISTGVAIGASLSNVMIV